MPAPALSERDLTVLRSFARRIDPSDAGAHNNLGVLYYQKGLVDEAIAEFARALELDPKMQVAQANLEIAYRDSGHYDRRIDELKERREPEPERSGAPAGSWAEPMPCWGGMRRPRRSSRRSWPSIRKISPQCSSWVWPRRRAAGWTRRATGWRARATRSRIIRLPGFTAGRCCITGASPN